MRRKTDNVATAEDIGEIAVVIILLFGFVGLVFGYSLLPEDNGIIEKIVYLVGGFIAVPIAFIIIQFLWISAGHICASFLSVFYDWLNSSEERNYFKIGLKLIIFYPVVVYFGICTITLVLLIMPNVFFSMFLSENLGLSKSESYILILFNIIVGFLGLGILDNLDDP